MKLVISSLLFILLFTQCSKSSSGTDVNADYMAMACVNGNCVGPNFYIQLINKNTGENYVTANNLTVSDIELRTASDRPANYNVSIASPNDSLSSVIVFPVTERNKMILRIRKSIEIEITYTSTASNSGLVLSNFSVKGYVFAASAMNKNYLLKIKI